MSLECDRVFGKTMPPQQCADEIEADYGKCKASFVCALTELEPAGYALCIAKVRSNSRRPLAWVPQHKRPVVATS